MTLVQNNINITGKVVEAEAFLTLASMDGSEIVRIKKFVGGRWVNFQTNFSTLASFIIISSTPLPCPIEMTTAQRAAYSGQPIFALDTDLSDSQTSACFVFRGGAASPDLSKWTPI